MFIQWMEPQKFLPVLSGWNRSHCVGENRHSDRNNQLAAAYEANQWLIAVAEGLAFVIF